MPAVNTPTAAENFAEKIAVKFAGPKPEADGRNEAGVSALDWTALTEVVTEILVSLLSDCPASDAKVVKIAKAPRLMQRARFAHLVDRKLRSNGRRIRWRRHAGDLADAIRNEAAAMPDAELMAVVFTTRNDDWLVI